MMAELGVDSSLIVQFSFVFVMPRSDLVRQRQLSGIPG
jgi:hypothetical protein